MSPSSPPPLLATLHFRECNKRFKAAVYCREERLTLLMEWHIKLYNAALTKGALEGSPILKEATEGVRAEFSRLFHNGAGVRWSTNSSGAAHILVNRAAE